ncbi:hypothetical protein QTP88_009931 [Uroleucon formosanum]
MAILVLNGLFDHLQAKLLRFPTKRVQVQFYYLLLTNFQADNLPHLPPRVPKRGQPKGKDKTVIGVPKKRKLTSKLLPFEEIPVDIRHYEMLRWFVDCSIAKSVVYENKSVHEKDIDIIPERVSNAIMDKAIFIAKPYQYDTMTHTTGELCELCELKNSSFGIFT